MAILKNTVIADSDPISLPMGTTAQRPVNPPEGSMRYNTDLGYTEVWINRSWGDLANGRASFLPRNNTKEPGSMMILQVGQGLAALGLILAEMIMTFG